MTPWVRFGPLLVSNEQNPGSFKQFQDEFYLPVWVLASVLMVVAETGEPVDVRGHGLVQHPPETRSSRPKAMEW